jgi:transposase
MKKRYVVKLTADERAQLEGLIKHGREAAYRRRHAEVLLLVDEGPDGPKQIDREVAKRTGFARRTVEQIRERCVTEGLAAALERKKRSRERARRLDGEAEAQLVSLACSEAPEGQARWTLHMLADKLVELEVVESVSHECVRQILKKHHQTLAEANVVYPGPGQCSLRVSNGSRAGGLQTPP